MLATGSRRHVWICHLTELLGGSKVLRDNLRATQACRLPLLAPPPAIGPETAGRQRLHRRRQLPSDTHRQLAPRAIEVFACTTGTRRREAKDLCRLNRAGEA